jgi:hypothetical protein
VDLDRAQPQVTEAYLGVPDVVAVPDDALLGARCRLLAAAASGFDVVLLEPVTEGRLAASLARFGEGFLVRYVIVGDGFVDLPRRAVAAGVDLSKAGDGPFGRQRLVLGGPRLGPHIVVASGRVEK